jgi:PHP family Zn ribbon phosphoesterase
LPEVVAEVAGVSPSSKTVRQTVDAMLELLGPELPILERLPLDAIDQAGFPAVADAIGKVRRGEVVRTPGFDGQYGSIRLASAPEGSLAGPTP